MSTNPTTTESPEVPARLSREERVALIEEMGWDPDRVSPNHPVFASPRVIELPQD